MKEWALSYAWCVLGLLSTAICISYIVIFNLAAAAASGALSFNITVLLLKEPSVITGDTYDHIMIRSSSPCEDWRLIGTGMCREVGSIAALIAFLQINSFKQSCTPSMSLTVSCFEGFGGAVEPA